ncbi:hypothetical protein [Methylovirgula sp. 4M-Z18]|uniref:hypothetical protein n=1 Tax=Methylovirgula sp. 4M-Z18 TaxID=2293567 RepID=UPI000E2FB1A2|nr:hypothetical protein [Methylovirgula sp. 4M-Z18]RFB76343.1 hypothetical protein DYH55_21185 [Methylovirgula sp. 4M-Z18]
MAANTGIIFGVIASNGSGVPGVQVSLNFIFGDPSQGYMSAGASCDAGGNVGGFPKTQTGDDGRFVLPFLWPGTDIAKVVDGKATASFLAIQFYSDGTYRCFNKRVRLFLGLDMRKLIQVGYTDPTGSPSDFANAAKDFYASYRDMLPAHGVFPTILPFSTEVWGLIGEVYGSFT